MPQVIHMQNAQNQMMVPVYTGYGQASKKEGKKSKKSKYDADTKKLFKQLGIDLDDEDDIIWLNRGAVQPYSGLDRKLGASAPYSVPVPLSPTGGYGGPMMQGGPMPGYGQMGSTSQLNIQYTAPDGTMYNMNVTSTEKNRGKALYNVLSGLYGLMNAEGTAGKYGKGGKGRGGYSGGGKGGK
jgi:hypothetical protein